jgi:PASTA domain
MGYVGSGLLGLFLGIGMGAAGGSPEIPPTAAAPTITQTIQSTVTATATATTTVTPTPTSAVATSAAAQPSAAAAAPEVFKMPKLVGENLQLAQDKLQKLGSFVLDQQDAAGLDRIQVVDSNWQVCSQKPAPGKTVSADTLVVLASVKLSEDCP